MPFPRPTLTVLRNQAMQDIIASDLPQADGFLRRSALRVMAWVQAGMAYLHYGYLDYIARQSTPFTATDEYLDAWSAIAPTPVIRIAPQAATGSATFTGTNTTHIPVGTLMVTSDGTQYVTTADAVVSASSVTSPIAAVVPGSAGNLDAGTPMTLVNPIAGINSAGTAGTLTGGTDLEANDPMRTRMLESYANAPAGGDAGDYVTWALEVPGVTRAWPWGNGMGAGTVVVYFMMDVAEAAHNGFPQGTNGVAAAEPRDTVAAGDQLTLANHLYPLQPVTALVYAVAPTPQPQNFTITGLSTISTDLQNAVKAAIASVLVALGDPRATTGISQSDIDAAINAVPGISPFAVTSPSAWPIVPAHGALLTLGAVTFS